MHDSQPSRSSRCRFLSTSGLAAAALVLPLKVKARSDDGIQGSMAPELEVEHWIDADGKPTRFNLAMHRGKWVFLKCWQSWCPGCHAHGFPALKKISDALVGNPKVTIAGIQTVFEGFEVNTVDKLRDIQLQYALHIPMGHDAGDVNGDHYPITMKNYRTGGTPWMILIDPDGTVVFNGFNINSDRAIEFLSKQTV